MNIEELLSDEQLSKIENPQLKSYIIGIKDKLVKKEEINPVEFMDNCLELMTDKEKGNKETVERNRRNNENATKAMEHIKKIQL